MEAINPVNSCDEDNAYFDPESYVGSGVLKRRCGYELIKENENVYRCINGNHRYGVNKE